MVFEIPTVNRVLCMLLWAALMMAPLVQAEVKRLSEPVTADSDSETFGGLLQEDAVQATLAELAMQPEAYLGEPVWVQARIARVCQMKGCFFIATDQGHSMRVSFLDYGFFIPTDSADKRVTLTAELVEKRITAADAEHMNVDLGGEAVASGVSYELVASAIRIPR